MGSLVRTTGSGLGCPDWPQCYGRLIAPTKVEELPENYRESFSTSGEEIAEFDPFKTWIEYINRLLGMVVGVEMFFLVLFSYGRGKVFFLALWTFALTIVQGWIGARVVATQLYPPVITVHMLMAVLILFFLHALFELTHPDKRLPRRPFFSLAPPLLLGLALVQVVLGTFVRQEVDTLINQDSHWPESPLAGHLGLLFVFHRFHATALLVAHGLFSFHLISRWGKEASPWVVKLSVPLFITLVAGIGTAFFRVPPPLASLHLLGSTLYVGLLFSFICKDRKRRV